MYCTRKLTGQVTWVGASDRRLALFENLFPIPRGVSYNSYLILDEKTAVIDTADAAVSRQFVENVLHTLDGRSLDYLVVNHMEPDHCANIEALVLRFPEMKLVGNAKTFTFMQQFYGFPLEGRTITVKEGDSLSLGSHTLHFYMAPMVHWPEVMVTYESSEKLLFSADAFGTFGALNGVLFSDEVNFDRDWLDDARRYYANIVGKYGTQVQAVLKKAAGIPIQVIAPLHGPIWRENLGWFLGKYDLWSRWQPEDNAVVILYGSMYGNTAAAAEALAGALADRGVQGIAVRDLSVADLSEAVAECFRASAIVLAAPTYNGGLYLPMAHLLEDLKALSLQNRTFALIENGSWAPMSAKLMAERVGELKNCTLLDARLTIRGALAPAQTADLAALADAVAAAVQA